MSGVRETGGVRRGVGLVGNGVGLEGGTSRTKGERGWTGGNGVGLGGEQSRIGGNGVGLDGERGRTWGLNLVFMKSDILIYA